ncbi:MAG: ATP-binding protein, partial [Kofleriaceae bacterium]
RLGQVATRLTPSQRWEDAVYPDDVAAQLAEIIARARHGRTVLDGWGFARKLDRGLGTTVLLSGPPGTGKTMAAGLLAAELGLDLYQVDLARITSKYLGETEKQLAELFAAAEAGTALLLFDEADALLAKRTEVKSANDRYANLGTNYLLQRLERFAGIAVLTTNHAHALDDALRRRIAVHIELAPPTARERATLWRRVLPADAPIADDVDADRLGREFELAGGAIRNAALRAAYLAADAGHALDHAVLERAARLERAALGRVG